jgi:hypothetical protein
LEKEKLRATAKLAGCPLPGTNIYSTPKLLFSWGKVHLLASASHFLIKLPHLFFKRLVAFSRCHLLPMAGTKVFTANQRA